MASFSRNTKTNTRLPIWDTTGGENHQFFLCKLPIDKTCRLWYNKGGGSTGRERQWRPDFPIGIPICEIFATSSDFSYAPDFSRKGRGRSVRHMFYLFPRRADRSTTFRRELPRFNKPTDLETYLKCPHICSHVFTFTPI
jgi:hypothetical protein